MTDITKKEVISKHGGSYSRSHEHPRPPTASPTAGLARRSRPCEGKAEVARTASRTQGRARAEPRGGSLRTPALGSPARQGRAGGAGHTAAKLRRLVPVPRAGKDAEVSASVWPRIHTHFPGLSPLITLFGAHRNLLGCKIPQGSQTASRKKRTNGFLIKCRMSKECAGTTCSSRESTHVALTSHAPLKFF